MSADDVVTLYRPVGQRELELIRASGSTRFPPRLPTQPIFYPVLDEGYAVEIARDWNTKDAASGFAGYVTRFRVQGPFIRRYAVQTVGARRHRELWIPAEELDALHAHLIGPIEVMAEFHGAAPPARPAWLLLRQDDDGSTFVVERFADRAAAEAAVRDLEARGHEQRYWVEAAGGA